MKPTGSMNPIQPIRPIRPIQPISLESIIYHFLSIIYYFNFSLFHSSMVPVLLLKLAPI